MGKMTEHICECIKAGGTDLHLHTSYSDGADNVVSLVQKVLANGLKCFAVTDHDGIDAIPEVLQLLQRLKELDFSIPEFIPGIELSADHAGEIHILGYFPSGRYRNMEKFILRQRESREQRNVELCECLTRMGMPITLEELHAEGRRSIGRLHAANILIRKGYISSVKEAFDTLFGYGKPCYIKREKPDAQQAISAIKEAGGVPVLAHPFLYGWTGSVPGCVSEKLVSGLFELKKMGLEGVESFHGEATQIQKEETFAAGSVTGLFSTAGSDYHGDNKSGVRMYTGESIFLNKRTKYYAAAIIRVGEKVLVEKISEMTGCGEKCRFPSISSQDISDEKIKEELLEYVRKNISSQCSEPKYYSTVYSFDEENRTIMSSYIFEFSEICDDPRYQALSLKETVQASMPKLHLDIAVKLREISIFDFTE